MTILLAWIASISSGLEPLILKASSKTLIKSSWLFNVFWVGATYPLVVPLMLLWGAGMPHSWGVFVALGIFHALFFLLYSTALFKIDTSTMAPLFSFRTVFAVLLGVVVLHEQLSILSILLVCVIILASPLASFDEHLGLRAFKNKYIFVAIASMTALALTGYFVNKAYAENGFTTTVLWQDTFTLLFLAPSLFFVKWQDETWTKQKAVPFAALGVTGFIYVASSAIAYGKAYTISSVIVSLPLSMIFVWIASKKFSSWLESHPPYVYKIRFIGAAIMVTCAILLSVLK
ncbi:MAG: EamA protein [Patescibacteria group bacterium]|nr:EamA family transporter [Candidatus Saccharibacteria bacterium]MDQ5963267.1 EamA protein [Patescibacteria group bacterium]